MEVNVPEAKSQSGGCHCGHVRYEVTTDLGKVIDCNCSICEKAGYLLTFVPTSAFKLVSGAEHLKDYQFNKKVIHHVFCDTCGTHSFARGAAPDGTEMIAINVRCLDNIDLNALTPTPFDGKKL